MDAGSQVAGVVAKRQGVAGVSQGGVVLPPAFIPKGSPPEPAELTPGYLRSQSVFERFIPLAEGEAGPVIIPCIPVHKGSRAFFSFHLEGSQFFSALVEYEGPGGPPILARCNLTVQFADVATRSGETDVSAESFEPKGMYDPLGIGIGVDEKETLIHASPTQDIVVDVAYSDFKNLKVYGTRAIIILEEYWYAGESESSGSPGDVLNLTAGTMAVGLQSTGSVPS